MSYNRLQVMRDNIEAIRLALSLGAKGRGAQTAEEIAVLRKYAGFGGLKCILNDANELADAAKWSKSDIELFAPTVELRRLIHDYSHNDREFKDYMDSLKASVLTAFYTDNRIVDAISDALKYQGVEIKSFLEPSAGQGAFIDSFLRNDRYPGAEVLAYEKDLLTGKILSALHPSILTRIEGFEKIERDFNGYFDVAASNVPFGDFAVADPAYAVSKEIAYRQASKSLHNYFFLKGLDQVRDGGLIAFITSQGVMNAASPFIRINRLILWQRCVCQTTLSAKTPELMWALTLLFSRSTQERSHCRLMKSFSFSRLLTVARKCRATNSFRRFRRM